MFHGEKIKNLDKTEISKKLGADVPIFLEQKSGFASGVGEVFEKEHSFRSEYLIISPNFNISTKDLYNSKFLQTNSQPDKKTNSFFEPLKSESHEFKAFYDYLIDIGGEIAANGSSKNGVWTIGIQDPQSLQQNVSFTVTNSSKFIGVATSGDYLNFKYLDGELVSHSIDPRITKSKDNNVLSVTVLDESSVSRADAFATAFNIMSLDESVELSESLGIKVKIIYISDGLIKYFESKSWQNMNYE